MGLGEVKINIQNGALGSAPLSESGITGMVITGTAIAGKLNLGESKAFYSMQAVEALGIDELSNPLAYRQIKGFYDQAGAGAELWIMLVDSAVKASEMVDLSQSYLSTLMEDSKFRLRLAGVSALVSTAPEANEGITADVISAITPAQALADHYSQDFNHLRVILDGSNFNGSPSDLTDLTPKEASRVSVLISNTENTRNADIGMLLGRLASDPVQRHPARVKSGRVSETAYFGLDHSPESMVSTFTAIANKGYVFLRPYSGKLGYFFSDAPTCTPLTDDFNQIPNGRVMDKAVRLAYQTYIDEIKDEIPVEASGKISPILIKAWEAKIASVLNVSMVAEGEISGHSVFIDANQDILATGTIQIELGIQPVGYADKIIMNLGFTKSTE